jgi:DNA-binding GntR family transcriptional regulator
MVDPAILPPFAWAAVMKSASRRTKTKNVAVTALLSSETKLTLTEQVYTALKRDIITGALPPGQAFTEMDLAEQYGASRTPVREAAVRLQEEELVRIVANRGYFVTQLTIHGMNDVYEYRAAVESACAELLCGIKIPTKTLADLEAAAHFQAEDEGRFGAFIEADTAFHLGIARLTHNALLVRAVSQMRTQTERIMFAAAESIDLSDYGKLPAREHTAIWRPSGPMIPISPAASCDSTS